MHALVRCGHAVSLRQAMRQYWDLLDEEQFLHLTPENLVPLITELQIDRGARMLVLLWRTWQKYWTELCSVRQLGDCSDPKGKRPTSDSLCVGKRRARENKPDRWSAPQEGGGWPGIGVVIRDSSGAVQLTAWKNVADGRDAEELESLACKEGLSLAADWCQQCAILETDCCSIATNAGVIGSPSGKSSKRRERNSVAHELAQLAQQCGVLCGAKALFSSKK
uniref:RNase H type-1 domain-containing protein n=1 Tax=Setaria viridis TaxID=4556 RepID=A0A4U6SZA8_SETVI|nr:hypothetical protein SEVIR_9G295500v2 [Setaria viridis]